MNVVLSDFDRATEKAHAWEEGSDPDMAHIGAALLRMMEGVRRSNPSPQPQRRSFSYAAASHDALLDEREI
jgi:hypothetical protein